mmetsp:Transcript_3707/g.4239  ORF Transcript_3707/g.4239 Transcript_3707/m.4239 type:complete len:91 (+) Transcript_3707:244-516(+)
MRPFGIACLSDRDTFIRTLRIAQIRKYEDFGQSLIVPSVEILFENQQQSWVAGTELKGRVRIIFSNPHENSVEDIRFAAKTLTLQLLGIE